MKKLWIDDIRDSPDDSWIIVRSSNAAIRYITKEGMPNRIAFDHDLGDDDTSILIIKFIVESFLDGSLTIPNDFDYSVHSMNPIGSKNIKEYMNRFLTFVRTGE